MSPRDLVAATLLGLALAAPAGAATANADLTCHTRDEEDPELTLEANIPVSVEGRAPRKDFSLTIAAAGNQATYTADGAGVGDGIDVMSNLHDGVFTLVIWRVEVELTLKALPQRVTKSTAPDGRERFEFTALLQFASLPGSERGRWGYDSDARDLILRCTQDFAMPESP